MARARAPQERACATRRARGVVGRPRPCRPRSARALGPDAGGFIYIAMHAPTRTAVLALGLVLAPSVARPQRAAPDGGPPNAPLTLAQRDGRVTLTYAGRTILDATISNPRAELRALVDTTASGAVTQVLKWTVRDGSRLTISGTVRGSGEAWPAEADPRPEAAPIVRNATGPADDRLDRAVYDRHGDWVLSVDVPAAARLTTTNATADSTAFHIEVTGAEIALRFRPRFYQRHRGLRWYRPWSHRVWDRSVAGWTSWYAYFDAVTESDVHRAADVVAAELHPYGYDYLQIDDGYQRTPLGPPANWLHTNAKFPSGLAALRRYIADRGLQPALWTNVAFEDSAYVRAHPSEFVPAATFEPATGRTLAGPAYGNWIGYVLDGSNPTAIRDIVRPIYDSLAAMGWSYLKLDALRHLKYEGYDSHADYYRAKGLDRDSVFRSVVQVVRDAIGERTFLLACWGIRPELIGLVDAVRVGNDGFGYGAFAQYNSFNNVVWRNDPDHIQLAAADAHRAATLASLTGSLLMLTDKPDVYLGDRAEIARRTAPVLFTRPRQLYDVDPSRSSRIGDADVAVSGSGPRPMDADQRLTVPLYQLDVARPFERWTVLARAGGDDAPIRFADLGIAPDREQLVFEFWTKTLVGSFVDHFTPGAIDPRYGVQVFCLRDRLPHPQLVATNRHVSCGAVDLRDDEWHEDGTLSGASDVVGGDTYELYLTEPAGWKFVGASVEGAELVGTPRTGALRVVRMRGARSGRVTWSVRFAKE